MKNLFKKLPFFSVVIITVIVLAKIASIVLYYFLPLEGVSLEKRYDFTPEYIRVDLKRIFLGEKEPKNIVIATNKVASFSMNDFVLKALYGTTKKGFIVIAQKSNPKKTSIVSVGEKYHGYKLKGIYLSYVLFEKNNKTYKLSLENIKKQHYQKVPSQKQEDNDYVVSSNDIAFFANNPREIWRNISIKEIRKDGHIEGFKVTWIKKGSKFAKLGLKRGDIIIKANNKKLQSYKDALDIYKNINHLDELSLIVLRNGVQKEIVYEVH